MQHGRLIFFCGKMGAGKTTKAMEMSLERNAVLLSEDEWLAALFPNKIATLDDYIKYSQRLKPAIKQLVLSILQSGTDVIMDFPANTVSQRQWFREIFNEANAPHSLIYIDVSNEICLQHIEKRRDEQPQRATTDTVEMFAQVNRYFVEPIPGEGFNLTRVSSAV